MRAHCPVCGPGRNAQVMGEHEEYWSDPEDGISGTNRFRILKCAGCDTVYFQKEWENDWDMVPDPDEPGGYVPRARHEYWPSAAVSSRPAWVNDLTETDFTLYHLLQETYQALNNGLPITAALGMRTAFDRASELLGVDPRLPFATKLSRLEQDGQIGKNEKDALSALVDAGSAAAHRAWRPTVGQLTTMISIIELFLHRSFFVNEAAKHLKAKVPPKPT